MGTGSKGLLSDKHDPQLAKVVVSCKEVDSGLLSVVFGLKYKLAILHAVKGPL